MFVALGSCLMLMLGVRAALSASEQDAIAAARSELIGGSLLATGLVLIGLGIQSSFC